MKTTFHFLGALAVSAVVAFGAVSCNQTKGEATESPAGEATEAVDASAPKGAIVLNIGFLEF